MNGSRVIYVVKAYFASINLNLQLDEKIEKMTIQQHNNRLAGFS